MMFFWCSSIVSLAMFALAGLVTPRPFQPLWWRCQRCGWVIRLRLGLHSLCWRGLPAFRRGVMCFDRTDHLGESHLVGLITVLHYSHDTRFLFLPVAIALSFSLVVEFLAGRQVDARLHQMSFPIQRGAHAGLTLLRDTGINLCQLFLQRVVFWCGSDPIRSASIPYQVA